MSHDEPATARLSPAGASPPGERATSAIALVHTRSESTTSHGNDAGRGSIDSPVGGGWSRKRRWLTTLITPIAVVVMAVGGHRAWTWQAERKLGILVDELRRKGEPVSLAEI